MAQVTRRRVTLLPPDSTLFLGGSLLTFGVVYGGVPALAAVGVEPMVAWMLLSMFPW